MLIVHVHVKVCPDEVGAFTEATKLNAAASAEEPGVVRFDVLREADDPTDGAARGAPVDGPVYGGNADETDKAGSVCRCSPLNSRCHI